MKTFHYIIAGRVQGVFFRYHTQRVANEHSIFGTVKNLSDGNVEVFAQGDEQNLEKFEQFLNKGPEISRVDKIIKKELDIEKKYHSFEIIF